jgi:cytochrome c551/c552
MAARRGPPEQNNKQTHMKKLLILTIAMAGLVALSARAADGKALYEEKCAKCHGADGKGDTKMGKKLGAKDYSDAKVQAELTDDAAIKAIKEGAKDKEGKVVMKPTEGVSDDEAKAIVAHLRTLKK